MIDLNENEDSSLLLPKAILAILPPLVCQGLVGIVRDSGLSLAMSLMRFASALPALTLRLSYPFLPFSQSPMHTPDPTSPLGAVGLPP